MKKSPFFSMLLAILVTAAFACAPESDLDTDADRNATATTDSSDTASDIELSGKEPFEATVSDSGITMPSEIPAGPQMITVENTGSSEHGFAISGPVQASLDRQLQPLEVGTISVVLTPGQYRAYCTVDPTMEATFTVTQAAMDPMTDTAPMTDTTATSAPANN